MKQVTLYKHGIGFFQREGTVAAGEEARLDFKSSELNDVLKSLIVATQGGGGISAVRYDSQATLEQQLQKFPFSVGSGEALSSFLDSLKGAHVEIKVGDRSLSGAIVSARTIGAGTTDKRPNVGEQLTLMLDSGDLANYELSSISTLHLLDARLQQQLKQYLETLAQAKSKDTRSIYLASPNNANRSLHLSYIAPAAIWKSSYRLNLDASKSNLEGWAVVDNTSDEDWTNVRLSVVSGRPISFISLLDVPRYGNRQVAELPEDRAAGPVVYGGGAGLDPQEKDALVYVPGAGLTMSEQMGLSSKENRFQRRDSTTVLGVGKQPEAEGPNEFSRLEGYASLQSSIRGASGATLGELFEYNFAGPVSIKKNQSAMLPFLRNNVDAHKLLIYQETAGEHPVNAVEITNNTGKTLDGGPITIFDAGAYAGEALIETLKTSDKSLVGYAIDYGMRIASSWGQTDNLVQQISAQNGVLQIRLAEQRTRTYDLKNIDPKPKTVIVEQEGVGQFSVVSTAPSERTSTAYRFKVEVPASGSKSLTVKQERILNQQTTVSNATSDSLVEISKNRELSASGRKQLEAIIRLKSGVVEAGAAVDSTKGKLQDLTQEQERLRQNINSLNQVKGQEDQVRKYSSQLSANESSMAKLRDSRDDDAQRKLALEDQLRQAILKLDF